MKENYLDLKLHDYGKKDIYPFHMPGHKRMDMGILHPEKIDITEIDGFDNLHHAEGIIDESQKRMAELFGADYSFFLVNGSTAGLLTAICTVAERGSRILIARNCHKAVYHGIFLQQLQAEYVYPEVTEFGIQGSISPEKVKEKLNLQPDTAAVLITSPTYDGVISDIGRISKIVHERGIPLIVDEAHGAHFGFSEGFPQKALAEGADLVIESLHKTLPSYTQTAVLHVKGNRVSYRRLREYLGIFQTSSPSYIFMAGMDRLSRLLIERKKELFETLEQYLEAFYKDMENLRCLEIFQGTHHPGIFGKDPSKILISAAKVQINGICLADILLKKYYLQMEMASGHYVTALTSICDTKEGFSRLSQALMDLDEKFLADRNSDLSKTLTVSDCQLYRELPRAMEIYKAKESAEREIELNCGAGAVSAEYIYLYPPGIPLAVPGEVLTEELIRNIRILREEGFMVQGMDDKTGKRINIVI